MSEKAVGAMEVLGGARDDLQGRLDSLTGKDEASAMARSALAGCLNVIDAAQAGMTAHAGNGDAQ